MLRIPTKEMLLTKCNPPEIQSRAPTNPPRKKNMKPSPLQISLYTSTRGCCSPPLAIVQLALLGSWQTTKCKQNIYIYRGIKEIAQLPKVL